MTNSIDFCDPPTHHVAPSLGQSLNLSTILILKIPAMLMTSPSASADVCVYVHWLAISGPFSKSSRQVLSSGKLK